MIEQIKFTEITNNIFLGNRICGFLAQLREDGGYLPGVENPILTADGEKCVEVELKINGRPVSFRKTIERLEESYDWSVKKEAEKLVNDKLSDLDNFLYDMTKHIKNQMQDRLGIEPEN